MAFLNKFRFAIKSGGGLGQIWREYTKDQKLFVAQSALNASANIVTGGVFLAGLLVLLGTPDLLAGIVLNSGAWAMMLSLPASLIIERTRRRKALMTASLAAFRLLTTLPAFLPLVFGTGSGGHAVLAAAICMIAGNAVFSIFNTGYNIYFMDSVPQEGRVSYIYTRMLILRIAYTLSSFACGILLDALNKTVLGFVIVFSMGIVLGVADLVTFAAVRGSGGTVDAGPPAPGLMQRLFAPFRHGKYRRFLLYTFLYFLCYQTAASYTPLYQVKYMGLDYVSLTIYNTSIYVLMIAVTRKWAARHESQGTLRVLILSMLLLPLDLVACAFLTPGTWWVLVFSVVFAALGSSGYWASVLPYRYDLMPEDCKPIYEGWYLLLYGASLLLGAFLGGKLQGVLPPDTSIPGFAQAPNFASVFAVHIGSAVLRVSKFQIIYFFAGALSVLITWLFWRSAKRDMANEQGRA